MSKKTDKNKRQFFDVIIIGAGASGMTAAVFAARKGARVLILEHKDKLGKKILATGNGKCNFTNQNMKPEFFRGDDRLIGVCMDIFSYQDTLAFFESLGIYPKIKNGYVYPNSEQAASVTQAFERELNRLNVQITYNTEINSIESYQKYSGENVFDVNAGDLMLSCGKLVIACGLKANPKLGSDGSIFGLIKDMGHRFTPIVPALCGFYCSGMDFKKAAGVRVEGRVRAVIDGTVVCEDRGEIQFADYGLSGIPVFQISRFISLGLYNKKKCQIEVDLFPDFSRTELKEYLQKRINLFEDNDTVTDFFNGLLNSKLAMAILGKCRYKSDMKLSELSDSKLEVLVTALTENTVDIDKWRDFEFAQVCAGGIRTDEINTETLESLIVPDLYFTGEILDVDGICGGYNLQWAWASGYIVGNNWKK